MGLVLHSILSILLLLVGLFIYEFVFKLYRTLNFYKS